jgi:hypothetical protein
MRLHSFFESLDKSLGYFGTPAGTGSFLLIGWCEALQLSERRAVGLGGGPGTEKGSVFVCCLLAGEVLPTANDHVRVLRIELHHAAGAACLFRRGSGCFLIRRRDRERGSRL